MEADALPLRVSHAGLHRCGPDWSLTPARTRVWTDLDLWVLIDGVGHLDSPQGRIELAPGACLLLRGGENYTFRPAARSRFVHYWAHFDYLQADGSVLHYRDAPLPPLHRRLPSLVAMSELLDRVIEALQRNEPARASRWLAAAMMEVARIDRETRAPASPCPACVQALRDRIRRAPHQPLDLARTAAAAGLSRGSMHRLFVRHVGMSPRQFSVTHRMEAARSLLLQSDCSIGQIASDCGYSDVFFFSRHFKQHHGMSPTQFRCQQHQSGGTTGGGDQRDRLALKQAMR